MTMNSLYEKVEIPDTEEKMATGWLPPMPDFRDYSQTHDEIKPIIEKLGILKSETLAMPGSVDLRAHCPPIENQKSLGSCTANAAAGIVEYFERRAFGKHIDCSRLFIYKTTRDLMGVIGDTGAWLRNTMGALALCGAPPEKYWPYTDTSPDFDEEPSAFVYSLADNFEALRYFCHDPLTSSVSGDTVLSTVKRYLAYGIPSMFGFWGFPSFNNTNVVGGIPYPCPGERAAWGHAIVAVGYDDAKKIKNTRCKKETTGALLIRNSWGTGWGDHGYGWIPYQYVLDKIALDFWSLISMEYVNTGQFHF
jgi:C1A family cysteine protease